MTVNNELPKERWYCVQIRPNEEDRAREHLNRQGFAPFFPRVEIRLTKKTLRIEPAFRGYGFVYLDVLTQEWQKISNTRGVIRMLPFHKEYPQPLPIGMVEYWKDNDPIPEDKLLEIFDEFYPGMVVQFRREGHPINGKKAEVLQVRSRLLEISFLGIFGATSSIWVESQHVVPVEG